MYIIIKTTKSTGRWRSFEKPYHEIMYNKIAIGYMEHEMLTMRVKVIKKDINSDGNPNCKWKWVTLKYNPTSIQDAKSYLKTFTKEILTKLDICFD